MNKTELAQLIHKFRSGKATVEERQALEAYWETAKTDRALMDRMSLDEQQHLKEETFQSIQQRLGLKKEKGVRLFPISRSVYKVAASLILFMSLASVWYIMRTQKPVPQEAVATVDNEIQTKNPATG